MLRPKRAAATKVTDFWKYHLSGDLDQTLQGRVDTRISQFEMAANPEDLQRQLEEEKEASKKLMEEAEYMKLQAELDNEKLKQKQWQEAINEIHETQEHAQAEHAKFLGQLKEMSTAAQAESIGNILKWFQTKAAEINSLGEHIRPSEEQERLRKEQEQKETQIKELKTQQEEISRKLTELCGAQANSPTITEEQRPEDMLQNLKLALSGKKEEDPNKTAQGLIGHTKQDAR